jgi:hydroxymethylbilane synthase
MSTPFNPIRIGTRGSALARWQAEHVAAALRAIPGVPDPELVLIKTEGDRIQDVPLSKVQGKAFFTKEIEEALLLDRVDVAVHSLKDLATEMPPGLTLGAVMEREDPRDALLFSRSHGPAHTPDDLPRGARVGTSSLRRRALLARWRPDLELAELRGNVPTRVRKLDHGDYDAIILAAAGVKRLGLTHRISAYLPFETFLPAVSQGAIGVQIRADDAEVAEWVGSLEHPGTRAATTAERALLRTMEGGCQVPVGAFAELDGTGLRLRGVVCSLDGSRGVDGEISGTAEEAERLGVELAQELIRKGGGEILEEIRGGSGEG